MTAPVVLIVGGSRGIGAATVLLAAEKGYDVAFTYKSNGERAEAVAADVRALGRQALPIQADAIVEDDVLRTFAEVKQAFGRLDGLVYNAGVSAEHSRLDVVDTASMRWVLELNTLAPMVHCREAVKCMSTKHGGQGGNIVLVSSRASAYGAPGRCIWYAASKGGVDSFTIGLAREVGTEGIRVNAVSPGPIRTEMVTAYQLGVTAQTTALKRPGEPREVADVIMYLLSDASTFVTGTNVLVGGGR